MLKTSGVKKDILINQLKDSRVSQMKSDVPKRRHQKKVPALQVLSSRVIMKRSYPKKVLNIAYCNFVWEDRVRIWKEKARVEDKISIFGLDDYLEPFYVPDVNEASNFEVGVYDKTHLGSNLRKALCLDKIEGISKSAWTKVSDNDPDILNSALLDVSEEGKILDQMKEKLARSLLTEEIEEKMIINQDMKEAEFCHIMRECLYVTNLAYLQ